MRVRRNESMVSPSGTGIARKLIAKIVQRELKARRQLQRVRDGLGQIGKQPQHLLRRFDIALAVVRQQTSGSIERAMVADAGEDIQNLALFRLGILRALRCQQRQSQAARQFDRRLIAGLLRAVVVALQLDVNIFVAVDRDELFERAAACFHAAVRQRIS